MGTLFIVATPIGNLEDLTFRALRTLGEVDLVLCEDTRVTRKLLSHYDIHTHTERFDAHTEHGKTRRILERVKEGENIALVSDAGTPAISDPGSALVALARQEGIRVAAIPGPSALTTALSVAGINGSDFLFLGFLPHKKGRETIFKDIATSVHTVVLYESPHRLFKTLTSLKEHIGEGERIILARELTKLHEEVVAGTPDEHMKRLGGESRVKGEFVVIIPK